MARIAVFLIALCAAYLGALPSPASIRPGFRPGFGTEIRVRLEEGAAVVHVRGFDLRISEAAPGPHPGARRLAAVADRESRWEMRCEQGRVRAHRLSRAGGGKWLDLAEPTVIRSPAGFLEYEGKPYREQLMVYSEGSLCEVINRVDLEKYLAGLVNAEFSSRWNPEAIGAQVVAARTYALFQMRQAREQGSRYDIDATTHDQVYDGSMKEDPEAARIVQKTRGWVLTIRTPRGIEPLKAYYSANCGGMTELPSEVWGSSNKGFRRVSCPYGARAPGAHWSFDLSEDQVISALRRAARGVADTAHWPRDWRKLLSRGHLRGIQVGRYDPSGRVEKLFLTFELSGRQREWPMTGAKFRQWLGPAQFKSTAFSVRMAGLPFRANGGRHLSWRFTGRGNGHGVGLCQWGAKAMGERGFKTAQILKFYYPGADLRKLW